MLKIISGLLAAGVLVGSPILPVSTRFMWAYQVPCSVFTHATTVPQVGTQDASSTPKVASNLVYEPYIPANCIGVASVAVFKDAQGQLYYSEIPNSQYAAMGQKHGAKQNPTDTQFVSPLALFTPKANAANCSVASSTASLASSGSGGLSVTYSVTVAGTNPYLEVYAGDQAGDTVTALTYNSVGMTQLKKIARNPGGGLEIYGYGMANPSTGANNVVVTRSGTGGSLFSGAIVFNDAQQTTSPIDVATSSNGSGGTASSVTTFLTTVSANACASGFAILDNGSPSAGNNETGLATASAGFVLWRGTVMPTIEAGSTTAYTANGAVGSAIAQVVLSIDTAASTASTITTICVNNICFNQ